MKGCIASKKVSGKIRYYIVVDLPRIKGQKRKQKWISAGTSKREAEKALPRILLDIQSQNYISAKEVLFRDFADDYLYKNKKSLADSTYKRYSSIVEKQKEFFADIPIQQIEPIMVEQFFKKLAKNNLAPSTIAKYRVVLSQIFEYALELHIVNHLPITKLKLNKATNSHDYQVWSVEQIDSFLDKLYGTPLYMPVFIASHTGMRLGEVLALKWSEINFKNKQLLVRYSVDLDGNLKNTKTKKSKRTISLMNNTVDVLKKHKTMQKKNRLELGEDYFKSDFVCTFDDGKPISRNYVATTFPRKIKQYNYSKIRFHDLRHSFATIAISSGVNVKVIQDILGHSTIKTTLDIYSHVIPTMEEQTVNVLEEAFKKEKKAT